MTRLIHAGAVAAILSAPASAWACATCGCSLSSDSAAGYSTGYSSSPGWAVSLLYSYIDQSQLRSGSHSVPATQASAINDNGGGQEVERRTTNDYLTLGIAYSPNEDWTLNAQIPYIIRTHTTYGNATSDQLTPDNLSTAAFNNLGDVKLIGSYQGLLPTHALGVQFGVKLPTGDYGGQNTVTGAVVGRHPISFSSGPNGSGQSLDTSLQPGTGSTDLIVGAYYSQAVSQDFDAFVNGQFQVAVAQLLDDANANYRPGNLANVSFGVRYEHTPVWVPQLQINISHKSADQGALADATDTAGTVVYVSPGVSVRLADNMHIFGIVQVPVKSWLDGYQLFPRWTGSVGLSYAF